MFEDRTTENLKKEALAAISPASGVSSMAGSYADATVGPLAQAVSRFYKALPAVTSMLFVDESSGLFIDKVAMDYHDLTRRAGTKAKCAVTLIGKAGTAIGAGTAFLTASGLRFNLLEPVIIPQSGSAIGWLEAEEAGAAYNVAEGAIDRMYVNVTGLESYRNEAADGGTDRESDAALYARLDEARKRPSTSGNGWDYRGWALEVDGVGEAKVVELAEGAGTVGLTLVDSGFRAPSMEIVSAVLKNVMAKKPIGAAPSVQPAEETEITVAAGLVLSGTTAGSVKPELEQRIGEYLRQLIKSKYQRIYYTPSEDTPYTLSYNRVLTILLTTPGVENFTALTVNGGATDLSIPAGSVPVLKEVSVT